MPAGKDAGPEMIYLQSRGGHVIGMTVPLHWTIEEQWQRGELLRVADEDGNPFDDGAPAAVETPPEPHTPARPAPGEHKKAWTEWAAAAGHVSAEDAEAMTKSELQQLGQPEAKTRK